MDTEEDCELRFRLKLPTTRDQLCSFLRREGTGGDITVALGNGERLDREGERPREPVGVQAAECIPFSKRRAAENAESARRNYLMDRITG